MIDIERHGDCAVLKFNRPDALNALLAPFDGVVRGLIRDGQQVANGMKIGDVDPRGDASTCFEISDKALAIAGGVVEAVLSWPPPAR